jgi:peptidoglycan/LPS O-acetylase OafA/YrhL
MSLLRVDKNNKIIELESIRGIAALLVFLHHIPNWNNGFYQMAIIRNSHLMVDLFFVLSGYVIYSSYGEKINQFKNILHFQFLRLGRLYPVHLVILVGYLLAEILKYFAAAYYGISFGRPAFDNFKRENVVANLLMIQDVGVLKGTWSINGPSWSIGIEFYIYLLFAFICLYLRCIKLLVFTAITSICILGLSIINEESYDIYSNILRGGAGFFLGCLVAVCSKRLKLRNTNIPVIIQHIAFLLISFFLLIKPTGRQFDILIYFLCAGLIISLIHTSDNPLKRILRSRIFTELGKISYSLYMSHMLIIWTVCNLLQFIIHKLHINDTLKFSLAYVTTIFITISISYFLFHIIEKPYREKSRKAASKILV